uniref:HTH cro/C1-type domain-containing protein n=1 Tax=uncultured Alphaproteobacteria bacterium TaxID=91750 RepID=A0A6G8F2A7_9PROT|nr:hypothetical protein PlAlph_0520 [uncultured Alphaproteobacteria bacterium]
MQSFSVYQHNRCTLAYDVADQLRKLRESRNISLESLSEHTKISVDTLKKLELGHVHELDYLYRLARFYDKKIKLTFE